MRLRWPWLALGIVWRGAGRRDCVLGERVSALVASPEATPSPEVTPVLSSTARGRLLVRSFESSTTQRAVEVAAFFRCYDKPWVDGRVERLAVDQRPSGFFAALTVCDA